MILRLSIPVPEEFLVAWLRLKPAEGTPPADAVYATLTQVAEDAVSLYISRTVEMAAILPAAPQQDRPGGPVEPS